MLGNFLSTTLQLAQQQDNGQSGDESGSGDSAVDDAQTEVSGFFENLQPTLEQGWTWIQNNASEFSIALAALIGVFIALRVLRAIIAGAMRRKKKGEYDPANVLSRLVSSTWSLFLLVIAAALIAPFFPIIPKGWGDYARTAAIIIGVIQAAIWARELLTSTIVGYASRSGHNSGVLTNAVSLIKTLVTFAVWIIAGLMILSNLDIEVTALIAGLGVGGIAIGLAAQSLFKDLFSSLAIVFDQPFLRGDFIMFDNGAYMGDVERIGMKTTRIRSLGGEQIVIANSQLLDKEIRNYRRMNERRIVFSVGVLYSTPHEKLKRIPDMIKSAIEDAENTRFDRSHLKEYGDSSINFETVYWVTDKDYNVFMDSNHEILLGIHRAFEDEGIDFAFPTRTLHVESFPTDTQPEQQEE